MKKLLLLVLLLISVIANAQKGISYQAVILDPSKIEIPGQDISGQPLANGNVSVKFVILSGTTSQFEEVQQTKTDAYGLVNLTIGSVASTAFNAMTWDAVQKSLQVYVSFNNGASYTKVSDQKLTYTPYALFAEIAGKLGSTLGIAGGGTSATTAAGARVNLGLGNVDNTADAAKPISTAMQAALNLKANAADVNAALDLKASAAMLAAHMAITVDTNMLATKAALTDLNNFAPKASPTFTGTVSGIDKSMVGLGSADNTSDAAKPISTATQAALDLKANTSNTATALSLKANTADMNLAFALKAPLNSPALTGVPTAPTAAPGTNTSQIATTAFTTAAIATATAGASSGVADNSVTSVKIADGSIATADLANGSVTDAKITSVAGSKITGIIPVASGGTGQTTVSGILSTLGFASNNIAIGSQAGTLNQGVNANTVAIGGGAGNTNQGQSSVAIGYVSGYQNQGANSISIGGNAAQGGQGTQAVAIGFAAGQNGQGANAVAIGTFAGQSSQAANSIAINATGTSTPLNPTTTGFFVDPIRSASATSNALYYNTTTREITSGAAASVSSQWTTSSSNIYYNAGNVGIGTTSPTAKLFVKGGTRNDMIRVESSDNPSISFKNTDPSGGTANIGEYQFFATGNPSNPSIAAGSFGLYYDHPSAAGYRFSVSKEGNVGIGTGMPTTKLDVAGAIKSSGTVTGSSFIKAGGTSSQYLMADGSVSSGGSSTVDVGTSATGVLPIINGGTGSNTKNFVDLTSNQTISGDKTFANNISVNGVYIGRGTGNDGANVALGGGTLGSGTGTRNTAIGYAALNKYSGTSFDGNTAVGYYNLVNLTSGQGNTSMGGEAMMGVTSGNENTSIGVQSLMNSNGNYNVGIGKGAGATLTTGSQNTIIGKSADVGANNLNNATAIGFGAIVTESNAIQLGNTSITKVNTSGAITGGNTATSTISGFAANMNTQTGTSYTLQASDNGKIITLNNASSITLTVPALFTGFNCMIVQLGAGQVTLTTSGTTISNRSSFTKTAGTNAIATLIGLSSTSFISAGDMQ